MAHQNRGSSVFAKSPPIILRAKEMPARTLGAGAKKIRASSHLSFCFLGKSNKCALKRVRFGMVGRAPCIALGFGCICKSYTSARPVHGLVFRKNSVRLGVVIGFALL